LVDDLVDTLGDAVEDMITTPSGGPF